MWTGEKIIFVELSVIVPNLKDMAPDSVEFAPHEYFFYIRLSTQERACKWTVRMRRIACRM